MGKIKEFFKKNPTAWEFAKYTIFSVLAGWIELGVFSLLNYVLPNNGINKPLNWFVFVYPTEAGGLGAFIAFVVSSVIGQALKFITNFKKTFKSTNNIVLSAVGFAIMAVIIVVGLNMYVGGLLNNALCKVIANADAAGFLPGKAYSANERILRDISDKQIRAHEKGQEPNPNHRKRSCFRLKQLFFEKSDAKGRFICFIFRLRNLRNRSLGYMRKTLLLTASGSPLS
ncbi:MAG TPA: hypothetical protein PKH08_01420 [Clostridia bacterium]|nr:hypothetical protein [Clostridia bacterium]